MADSDVDEPAPLRQGWDLIQAARLAEAVDVLRPYVASTPDDPVGLRRLAVALVGVGEPGEALPLVERSLALDPTAPRTYRAKALTLARLGRPQEALAAMRAAGDPTEPDDEVFLTLLYLQLPGGRSDAWRLVRRAAARQPANVHLRRMGAEIRRAWLRRCIATAFITLAAAATALIGYGFVGDATSADGALMAGLAMLLLVLPLGIVLGAIERLGYRRPPRPVALPAPWVRPFGDVASLAVGPVVTAALAWWSGASVVTVAVLALLVTGLGPGSVALSRRRGRRARATRFATLPAARQPSDGHVHEA
jgi:Flp pilus assembly protein TadD